MRSPILLIALGTFLPASAFADSCIMKQHVVAQSSDGRYIVRFELAGVWKGRIEDTRLETVFEANPEGLHFHAHFDAFITDDGERIVVFEPGLDNRPKANLLVFNRDLKLLKGFTLNELLTENDQRFVTHSISHCQYVGFDNAKGRRFGLEDSGKTFAIYLRSRRTALVSLAEPKTIPAPDVIPEVFEFEEGLPPGKTDHERIQGKWMITDGRSGKIMAPSDSFTDDPQYYLFVRDRVLTPGRRFDKHTFRLDESVTPHAIDLIGPGEKEPVKGIYEFRGGKLLICVPVDRGAPRPKVVDAKEFNGDYWTETSQRRKPRK